ncbi:MAG: SLBB domain-containing protein [Candidatus Edwardsbacteria bacterium]|nr:SLBB domain-containing protein [Candidatus Edwardsbacteria bacterium]
MSYQSKVILAALLAVFAGVSLAQQRSDGRDLYQLRSQPMMKIQVLGQVRTPGIYPLPVMERVSSALAAAGGTNEQGSPRSIQLIRQGRVVDTLDMYHYLYQNQQAENPILEDGDVLFVPVNSNNIKVVGQVFRPGIFEIKPGERLLDIIEMAGGITPVATKEDIKIENVATPDVVQSISYKNLFIDGDQTLNVLIKEGDVVTVPTAPTSVTVVGQVQKGGTFVFEPGTVLSYYLGMAGGYGERASTGNIRINRWGGKSLKAREDTPIEPGDVVIVGEMQIKGWRDYISVTGQLMTMFYIVWTVAN